MVSCFPHASSQHHCRASLPQNRQHQRVPISEISIMSQAKFSVEASTAKPDHVDAVSAAENTPQSNVQDLPEYWSYPTVHHAPGVIAPHREYGFCSRKGGLHVSWLHYCTLCAIIASMGFVLTVWTAVALHRSEPAFALSDYGFRSQSLRLLGPEGFHPPVTADTKRSSVIERARARTMTSTVFVYETITLTEMAGPLPTFPLAVQDEPFASFSPSPSHHGSASSLDLSGLVQQTSAVPMTTSQTTTWSTTNPPTLIKPIKPYTRYFGPGPRRL